MLMWRVVASHAQNEHNMKKFIIYSVAAIAVLLAVNFAMGYSKYSGVAEQAESSCLSDGEKPVFCDCVRSKMMSAYLMDGASSYSPLSEIIVPDNLSWTNSKFARNSRLDCTWLRES